MDVEITIKNYRCFSDVRPATIAIRPGFTAFVGTNNSGKSSLLRFFYEFRDLFQKLSSARLLDGLQRECVTQFPSSVLDKREILANANDRDLEIILKFGEEECPSKTVRAIRVSCKRDDPQQWKAEILSPGAKRRLADWSFKENRLQSADSQVFLELSALIDSLRSLVDAVYIGSFRNAINAGEKTDYFDIHVGRSLIDGWREYKSGNIKQHNEAARRVTQDVARIFSYDSLEINPSADGSTLQLIVDERSYRLDELGSGIAQFIIVLMNAAMKAPTYVLVDEPEIGLHPTLQVEFLTTLGSYATRGVLFSTHAIGLARACADRIYSITINDDGSRNVSDYERTPNLAEFLGEMSFAGFRELGFKSILLVEGPTDVRTIQQLLRKRRRDHRVVVLPLGGSSLINANVAPQLEEIKRLSESIYVLIDSERESDGDDLAPDRQAFVDACKRAGVECHVLQRRATENYLENRAVQRVKGSNFRALEPYEKLSQLNPSWGKEENWRIAREMSEEEFDDELKSFIDKL